MNTKSLLDINSYLDPSKFVQTMWKKLRGVPGGKKIFSKLLGTVVPYTSSINAIVDELDRGKAKILLKDKRSVRNHLNCIHAIALVNLGEVATGLPLLYGLRPGLRAILKSIEAEYIKKARGNLFAVSHFEIPDTIVDKTDITITASIFNEHSDIVTKVTAHWLVSPKR